MLLSTFSTVRLPVRGASLTSKVLEQIQRNQSSARKAVIQLGPYTILAFSVAWPAFSL